MPKWLVSFLLVKNNSVLSESDIEVALTDFLTKEFSDPKRPKIKVEAISVREVF